MFSFAYLNSAPTKNPTSVPTKNPTGKPTSNPSASPTNSPTLQPTSNPTSSPTSSSPSFSPSHSPTNSPITSYVYLLRTGIPGLFHFYFDHISADDLSPVFHLSESLHDGLFSLVGVGECVDEYGSAYSNILISVPSSSSSAAAESCGASCISAADAASLVGFTIANVALELKFCFCYFGNDVPLPSSVYNSILTSHGLGNGEVRRSNNQRNRICYKHNLPKVRPLRFIVPSSKQALTLLFDLDLALAIRSPLHHTFQPSDSIARSFPEPNRSHICFQRQPLVLCWFW